MKEEILGILILLILSCSEKPKAEFSLSGKTGNIENGTVLYMAYDEDLIDSVVVENNSFRFNTKLPKTPQLVILRTKNFSHYRFLWLENKPMTFDATHSDLRSAIVTGSNEEILSQTLIQQTELLSGDDRIKKEMEFVKKHPNSLHSAYVLSVYSSSWGKEKTKELFELFSAENRNSEYGKRIAKFIELNKNPQIGEKYVDFEMEDTNGEVRRLSDFHGHVILLEFWGSTCGPCRKENPNLVKTYEKYQTKGFEIFAVSDDIKKESWLKAIENDKLPWVQVSDLSRNNSAYLIYGIKSIPDNFLIDRDGIIIGRNLRGEELNKKLAELTGLSPDSAKQRPRYHQNAGGVNRTVKPPLPPVAN